MQVLLITLACQLLLQFHQFHTTHLSLTVSTFTLKMKKGNKFFSLQNFQLFFQPRINFLLTNNLFLQNCFHNLSACYWMYCGEGTCTKNSTYTHTCQCNSGHYNLYNISAFPCFSECKSNITIFIIYVFFISIYFFKKRKLQNLTVVVL